MNDGTIPTGCSVLDDLLGGGLERGTVTQIYGPPAAGKTNVALSAAVEVATDDGLVVYIDTEGLSLDRFEDIATAKADAEGMDVEAVTGNIVVKDALDFDEQAEAVKDVSEFAEQADLVVLDSATGFYRMERAKDAEGGDSLREVANQITHLLSLARRHDLAVCITNQVFTDPDSDRTRGLGGNTLEHWTGTIVRLDRFRGGNRKATLEKHRAKPAGESVQFTLTDTGIESADAGPP